VLDNITGEGTSFKSRHIVAKVHECRELVINGILMPYHVPSADLESDALSKPLAAVPFWKHMSKIMCLPVEYVNTVLYPDGGVLTGQSE
jgi:hypothetical protein